VERFTELPSHLRVTTEDMDSKGDRERFPLGIPQASEPHRYWKLLVELVTFKSESQRVREVLVNVGVRRSEPRCARNELTYNPWTAALLARIRKWSKLECWMTIV